jgi:hypothetical protein
MKFAQACAPTSGELSFGWSLPLPVLILYYHTIDFLSLIRLFVQSSVNL